MNDDMIRRQVALDTVERMYKACEGSLEDYHDLLVAAFVDLAPAHGDGDTISRAAAIDAINKALDRETLLNNFVRKVAVDAVKVLPSAQPYVPDTNVGDMVSRQAMIDEIDANVGILYDSPTLVESLKKMVMALPTVSKTETVDDCIGRQAAIDAIKTARVEDDGTYTWRGHRNLDLEFAAELLETIPTVQPETAKRIVGKSRDGMTLWYQCDMCNEPVDVHDNYCRGCGRRLIDE